MELKEQIISQTEPFLSHLGRLVCINSELSEAKPGIPFGEGNARVLHEALAIAEELGFTVKNLDNYCGYAEMGQGEQIVGIAAHLDIVPAGGDWTMDPFRLTRKGNLVYGRGTTDDKGPAMEALYAMKLLRDNGVPLGKRVRLIFGCNEETGSKCMEHYNEVAEELSCGFTPDACYPCIYGEKGHAAMTAYSKSTRILSMNGGFVSNAVCDECTTVIPAGIISAQALEKALDTKHLKVFTVTEADGKLNVFAKGTAAHASTPTLGVNAAGVTMQALAEAGFEDPFVRFYNTHIGTACDGSGIGLKFADAYGNLTLNNGIVRTENGVISCTIDIRVPVTLTKEQVLSMCDGKLEDADGRITVKEIGKPLFFPPDSPLVKALYEAYTDVTGDTEHKPMVIGGGTYAKSLKNIIAFGPEKEGIDYHVHSADEFLPIDEMQETVEIYYKAIQNLLEI